MKYIIIILLILIISCKSTHTTVTDTQVISDTLIKHTTKVITLPTHYTTIIKTPCKNDSLIIADQFLEIGSLKLKIINLNGQLVIETNTDSIINSKVSEILKHTEKELITIEKITTKNVIPKLVWYVLGAVLVYIIYRVARIYLPIIRFLPY